MDESLVFDGSAAVYARRSQSEEDWRDVDGGLSTVSVYVSTDNAHRVVALSSTQEYVLNAWLSADQQSYVRSSDNFVELLRATDTEDYGFSFSLAHEVDAFLAVLDAALGGAPAEAATSAQPTSNQPTEEERREATRQNVINEIVTTEAAYVKDLEVVTSVYANPLRQSGLLKGEEADTVQTFQTIFGTVDQLLLLSRQILAELKTTLAKPPGQQAVGAVFHKMAPFLKIYGTCIVKYDQQLQAVQKLRKRSSKFEKFCKEAKARPESHRLDLESFLIKPVQRITKYPLLLKELHKHTLPTDPDYDALGKALKTITDMVNEVNEQKRASDDQARLLELNREIPWAHAAKAADGRDWDLLSVGPPAASNASSSRLSLDRRASQMLPSGLERKVMRKVIKEGVLKDSAGERRLCLLFPDVFVAVPFAQGNSGMSMLDVRRFSGASGRKYGLPLVFDLGKCAVSDFAKDDTAGFSNAFGVMDYGSRHSIMLSAQSAADKKNWLDKLKQLTGQEAQEVAAAAAPAGAVSVEKLQEQQVVVQKQQEEALRKKQAALLIQQEATIKKQQELERLQQEHGQQKALNDIQQKMASDELVSQRQKLEAERNRLLREHEEQRKRLMDQQAKQLEAERQRLLAEQQKQLDAERQRWQEQQRREAAQWAEKQRQLEAERARLAELSAKHAQELEQKQEALQRLQQETVRKQVELERSVAARDQQMSAVAEENRLAASQLDERRQELEAERARLLQEQAAERQQLLQETARRLEEEKQRMLAEQQAQLEAERMRLRTMESEQQQMLMTEQHRLRQLSYEQEQQLRAAQQALYEQQQMAARKQQEDEAREKALKEQQEAISQQQQQETLREKQELERARLEHEQRRALLELQEKEVSEHLAVERQQLEQERARLLREQEEERARLKAEQQRQLEENWQRLAEQQKALEEERLRMLDEERKKLEEERLRLQQLRLETPAPPPPSPVPSPAPYERPASPSSFHRQHSSGDTTASSYATGQGYAVPAPLYEHTPPAPDYQHQAASDYPTASPAYHHPTPPPYAVNVADYSSTPASSGYGGYDQYAQTSQTSSPSLARQGSGYSAASSHDYSRSGSYRDLSAQSSYSEPTSAAPDYSLQSSGSSSGQQYGSYSAAGGSTSSGSAAAPSYSGSYATGGVMPTPFHLAGYTPSQQSSAYGGNSGNGQNSAGADSIYNAPQSGQAGAYSQNAAAPAYPSSVAPAYSHEAAPAYSANAAPAYGQNTAPAYAGASPSYADPSASHMSGYPPSYTPPATAGYPDPNAYYNQNQNYAAPGYPPPLYATPPPYGQQPPLVQQSFPGQYYGSAPQSGYPGYY